MATVTKRSRVGILPTAFPLTCNARLRSLRIGSRFSQWWAECPLYASTANPSSNLRSARACSARNSFASQLKRPARYSAIRPWECAQSVRATSQGVVLLEGAGGLGVGDGIRDFVERGRATGAEVVGVATGVVAAGGEGVVEQVRVGEGVVEVDLLQRDDPLHHVGTAVAGVPVVRDFLEAVVADPLEQGFAVGEVAVDRHGRDADFLGDAAHGHRGGAFAFEQDTGGVEDAVGGGGLRHVYSVHNPALAGQESMAWDRHGLSRSMFR